MNTIKSAFEKSGLNTFKQDLFKYDIWVLKDKNVIFPDNKNRSKHEYRWVIILQNDNDNNSPFVSTVLITPLSSKSKINYKLDYKLHKSKYKFLDKDSYIRFKYIQPILKTSLLEKKGTIHLEKDRKEINNVIFNLLIDEI
jgi:hypothetical protein